MARSFGRISTSIWHDPDFRALSLAAQWTYQMLLGQAGITAAGTLPITMRRWASYAPECDIEKALNELAAARFVVIDWDSEELLIRTFVKWDGGANNDQRRRAMLSTAEQVSSPLLRASIAAELNRLNIPHGLSDALPDSPTIGPREALAVVTERNQVPQPQPLADIREPGSPDDDPEPPTFCKQHRQAGPKGAPCRACGDQGKVHRAWLSRAPKRAAAKRAREALIAACPTCHGGGWVLDDNGDPTTHCDHEAAFRERTTA